jgi:hypothetical protein
MTKRKGFSAALLLFLVCSLSPVLVCQNSPVGSPPAGTPAVAPPPSKPIAPVLLREGTDVKLKFADDLSSKTARDDEPVPFILADDLKVGDVLVAKAGCKALGTVITANKAKTIGRPGQLKLRLDYLTVGNRRVPLRGAQGKAGETKAGTAAALGVLFGPVGLTKRGKDVEIEAGTPVTAYVDEDVLLPSVE